MSERVLRSIGQCRDNYDRFHFASTYGRHMLSEGVKAFSLPILERTLDQMVAPLMSLDHRVAIYGGKIAVPQMDEWGNASVTWVQNKDGVEGVFNGFAVRPNHENVAGTGLFAWLDHGAVRIENEYQEIITREHRTAVGLFGSETLDIAGLFGSHSLDLLDNDRFVSACDQLFFEADWDDEVTDEVREMAKMASAVLSREQSINAILTQYRFDKGQFVNDGLPWDIDRMWKHRVSYLHAYIGTQLHELMEVHMLDSEDVVEGSAVFHRFRAEYAAKGSRLFADVIFEDGTQDTIDLLAKNYRVVAQ